jgi:hypothetical protein
MITAALTGNVLRETYLRNIELGSGWQGPGADAALDRLVDLQVEAIQGRTGVLFKRKQVLTMPDAGTSPDLQGTPIPYVAPTGQPPGYTLILPLQHVQSLDRVRLFEGYDMSNAPIFETVPLSAVTLSPLDNKVRMDASVITAPELAQNWAIDYTIGLGQIPAEVAEWVLLGAAIQVLSIAGVGKDLSQGLVAETLSMDNQTETHTFGAQEYGLYSGLIKQLQRERDLIDMKRQGIGMRYQGLRLA